MATQQQTTQPSGVETKETPRPPDDSVVTDELETSGPGEKQPAAAGDQPGSKDQESAPGGEKDQQTQQQPGDSGRGAGKKIRRLQRQLAAEKDRNTANEARIGELESSIQELKQQSAPAKPKPQRKDFASDDAFGQAYATWSSDEAARKGKPADKPAGRQPPAKKSTAEETADAASRTAPDPALKGFMEKGKKRLGDEFLMASEAAAANEFAINQVMGDFLFDSDHGPEVFVYLSDHPELSKEIYDKSETYAIKALEGLALKAKNGTLIDGAETEQPGEQSGGKGGDDKGQQAGGGRPGGTKAPEPASTGGEPGAATQPDNLETMDMDDYAEMRRKQERARRHH